MTIETLLAELEGLTHRERMRRMVRIGRAAAEGDDAARATLDELWGSGKTYERTLALQAAYGSRGTAENDAERVVEAATSSSRTLRFRAMRLVATACDDAAAAVVLAKTSSRRARGRLLALLHRARRRGAVAAYLEGPGVLDDPQNVDLLPLATAAIVARERARFGQHASSVGWLRLAKHHPAIAAEEIRVAAEAKLDPRSRARLAPIMTVTARGAPDALLVAIALLVRNGEAIHVETWNELVKRRPRETFDLLRLRDERALVATNAPGAFGGIRLANVAHRLGPERLAHAVRRAHGTLPDGKRGRRWLLRLSPADRAATIDAWASATNLRGWGGFLLRHMPVEAAASAGVASRRAAFERWVAASSSRDGIIAVTRLQDLPRDLRHEEAERHLERVPALQGKNERLAWAQLLPFEHAKTSLASFLGHPEGEVRALAMSALVRTLDGDRTSVMPLLALVNARRFEQDPVRLTTMQALADQPWACFPLESLPVLAEIVEGALAASDLSTTTAAHTERLVVRLFRVDPEWGAAWLVAIVKTRGTITQLGLDEGLRPDDLVRFEPAFATLVETWATRERASAIVWLARSLGRRLSLAPSILSALERLARELPFVGVALAALELLRRAAPERFGRLVPELLATDASFAILAVVANHVSCIRQDLLPALLVGDAPFTGRFASGRTRFVLDFRHGVPTWTAKLQERWAAQLRALAATPDQDVPSLHFAIDHLASLAFADATPLLGFTADPRQPVREIAIDAAARLDAAEGLATLLACLEDDRARWAIYALRSVFAELPRVEVLGRLRAVPREKVTVAKEVVRLLGDLGGDDAFAEILAFDIPLTKRDVRIAMLRALWNHLHRPAAWEAFERAAADPDWIVASRIADVPTDRLTEDAEGRLADLLARVLDRPEAELRLDLLRRAPWLPLRDLSRRFFSAIVRRIGAETGEEARAALGAALHRVRGDDDAETNAIFEGIAAVVARRENTSAVLPTVRPPANGPAWRARLARAVLGVLANDPLALAPRIEFASHVLDVRELVALFEELHATGRLHVDAVNAALAAVDRCVHPSTIEERLQSSPAPLLRRIAFQAFLVLGWGRGWTRERRARLEVYRADPDVLVASAAAWIFPPPKKDAAARS